MKKLFTVLALISFLAIGFTSCTEEEVKPSTAQGGTGVSTEKP